MVVITCGICFNLLSEPVTWPCSHSFCQSCVKAQIDAVRSEQLDEDGTTAFSCPMCNVAHSIHREDLRGMVNDLLANRIAAMTKGVDGTLFCQWCEDVAATVHCTECPYVLCHDCNVAVHKNSAKRSHNPAPLQDPRAAKSISKKCPIRHHEEYKLDFYCTRCEELCCAYCLQMGPHHMHENVVVAKAAHEARQRMGRDVEALTNTKNRMENQAHDMNRCCAQYQETYDNVESLISDRFAAFHQQLAQKELEVRNQLQTLRESGDSGLADARTKYLAKLNAINEAVLQFRRLQHGGADYEVLENRALMSNHVKGDVPVVSGGVFRVSDLGDLHLTGLGISLDLSTAMPQPTPQSSAVNPTRSGMYGAPATAAPQSVPRTHSMQPSNGFGSNQSGTPYAAVSQTPSVVRQPSSSVVHQPPSSTAFQQHAPTHLTFIPDRDVPMVELRDGTQMQCAQNASVPQIGIRANETFEALRQMSGGAKIVSWRVRLDNVNDSKLGVVESASDEPKGFYWKPMKAGQHDGEVGRPAPALRNVAACRRGDVVTFGYDTTTGVLTLAVNDIEYGAVLLDVPIHFAPCFIFRPGETMTVIQ